MEIEMATRNIPFESYKKLLIRFKELQLKKEYEADFVCYHKIIVEIKALDVVAGKEEAQLLHYLKNHRVSCRSLDQFRKRWNS